MHVGMTDDGEAVAIRFEVAGLDEAGLGACLEEWVGLSARLDAVMGAVDPSIQAYGQTAIDYETPAGVLDEAAFFARVAEHPALYPKVRAFAEGLIRYIRRESMLWSHTEHPVGCHALFAVGLRDRAFLPLYARLICAQDMDYENCQDQQVIDLIAAHDWGAEVEWLAAARLGGAYGQNGSFLLQDIGERLREAVPALPGSDFQRRLVESLVYADDGHALAENLAHEQKIYPISNITGWLADTLGLADEAAEWEASGLALLRELAGTAVWDDDDAPADASDTSGPATDVAVLLAQAPCAAAHADFIAGSELAKSARRDKPKTCQSLSITKSTDAELQGIGAYTALRTLELNAPTLTVGALPYLAACPTITDLRFGDVCRLDGDVLAVARVLPELTDLRAQHLGPVSAAQLGHLAAHPALDDLNLEGSPLGPGSLAVLARIPRLARVLDLQADPQDTGDALLGAPWHGTLRGFTGSIPALSPDAFRWLLTAPSLSSLALTDSGVSDAHAFTLDSPTALVLLTLNGAPLGDAGMAHLIDCGALDRVSSLVLADCRYTDSTLARLRTLPKLRSLTVKGTRTLSDAALEHILALESLTSVCICACGFTHDRVLDFQRRARPRLDACYSPSAR